LRRLHVYPKRVSSTVILGRPKKEQLRTVPSMCCETMPSAFLDIEMCTSFGGTCQGLFTCRPLSLHFVPFPRARTKKTVRECPVSCLLGRATRVRRCETTLPWSGPEGTACRRSTRAFRKKGPIEARVPRN